MNVLSLKMSVLVKQEPIDQEQVNINDDFEKMESDEVEKLKNELNLNYGDIEVKGKEMIYVEYLKKFYIKIYKIKKDLEVIFLKFLFFKKIILNHFFEIQRCWKLIKTVQFMMMKI